MIKSEGVWSVSETGDDWAFPVEAIERDIVVAARADLNLVFMV